MAKQKHTKSKGIIKSTPQNMADGLRNYAKTITETVNRFAYQQNDPELARLYTINRLSIESLVKSAKRDFNIDLPEVPELPGGNDYYAGMINLADWHKGGAAILTAKVSAVSAEVPWDDNNEHFMSCADAIKFAVASNRKLSKSQLSKLLTPACPIYHMRQESPKRVKVNCDEFKRYIKSLPRRDISIDDIPDINPEALAELAADAAAQKRQAGQEARKIKRKTKLQTLLNKDPV